MRKQEKWMLAAILICGATVLTSCSDKADNSVKPESKKAVDYSDKNNWMRQPEATKDVDAFLSIPRNMTIPLRARRNLPPSMSLP